MKLLKPHYISKLFIYVGLLLISLLISSGNASQQQTLTVEEIEQGAMERLLSILPWDKESLEINVYYEGEDLILPPGERELIYKTRNVNKKAGRIPITLQININGNFHKRIRLNSRVLVFQDVIKTKQKIRRGEILTEDNIGLETIQTETPWKNPIRNIDNALGFEAGRNLQSGKILTSKFLRKPALASRGEKVLILAEKGGMKITTPGILKEDGFEDAMVQVLNIESKKIIYGRLVDSNTVKVRF